MGGISQIAQSALGGDVIHRTDEVADKLDPGSSEKGHKKWNEISGKYDYFDRNTDEHDKDMAALAAQQANLQEIGTAEQKKAQDLYKEGEAARTGPVSEGQQAALDSQKIKDADAVQAEKNQLAHFLATIGMSASGLATDLSGRIDLNKQIMDNNRTIMEDNMRRENAASFFNEAQAHYDNAMTALGLSNQQMQALAQQHAQDRAEKDQAYTGLLTTVATLVGTFYGGAPGGAAAGTLVNKLTGSENLRSTSSYA